MINWTWEKMRKEWKMISVSTSARKIGFIKKKPHKMSEGTQRQ